MPRIAHIAIALILLGGIHTAVAQEQSRDHISATDNAIADGDHVAAIRQLESALGVAQDQRDISRFAEIHAQLANVHVAQADFPAAESNLNKAIAAIDGSTDGEQADLPVLLVDRARLRIMTGNPAGAVADFERAISLREVQLGPQHITVADTLDELAEFHLGQSDLRSAITLFKRAAEIRERTLGESHPLAALGHDNLARVYLARGDTAAASSSLRQALRIRREAWNNRHPIIADNLERLAEVSIAQQDIEAAIELVEEALAIRVDLFGSENQAVVTTERRLAGLRQQLNKDLQPTLGAAVATDESSIPAPAAVDDQPHVTANDQPIAPAPKVPVRADDQPSEVAAAVTDLAAEAIVESPPESEVAAAPAVADPAAEAVVESPPENAGYLIQLSSLRSSDIARQEWQRLSTAHPEILGTHDLLLTTVELPDRGTFYRVRTGPFASSDAARQACADLEQRQQACLVIAP